MSERDGRLPWSPRPALFTVIFTAGMSFSLLGAMLPDISEAFGLTRTEVSALPLFQFGGDLAGLILLGILISRPSTLMAASTVVLSLSALAIALTPSFGPVLKLCFFFFGAASGILITLPGMVISRVSCGEAARSMNFLYAFFSLGVMIAPAGSGAMVWLGLGFREAFGALFLAGLVAAASTVLFRFPLPGLGQGLAPSALRDLLVNHRGIFIAIVFMNLCYVGSEAVPNAWIPKYLDDTFPGTGKFRSAAVLSLFWAAITAGRFACAAAVKRGVRPRALLAFLSFCATLCLAIAPSLSSRLGSEVLFIGSGLFFSGIFPLIIAHTENMPERTSGTMFIMVMAAGMLGASLAGRSTGVLADAVGFGWGMGAAALLSALVLFMTPVLGRFARPRP